MRDRLKNLIKQSIKLRDRWDYDRERCGKEDCVTCKENRELLHDFNEALGDAQKEV
jgi:hypothetical protein